MCSCCFISHASSDHIVDTRLATYYLDDMQVTGMIADEFLKHYGENAVPIPNSSTADKLSYLHKELQEKVVLCNQTLIDILLRSGKVRRVEDIMVENTPQPVVGRVLLKNLQEDEFPVLIEAEHLIKMVEPNFDTSHISFYEGRDPNVTYVSPTQFEVPKWMLSSDYVHHQIACPAQSPQSCHCASAFLCERILTAMGPRKNDAGDRKLQQLLMTLVLRTKGMQLKSVCPYCQSYMDRWVL
jgi:hypothetical protein